MHPYNTEEHVRKLVNHSTHDDIALDDAASEGVGTDISPFACGHIDISQSSRDLRTIRTTG